MKTKKIKNICMFVLVVLMFSVGVFAADKNIVPGKFGGALELIDNNPLAYVVETEHDLVYDLPDLNPEEGTIEFFIKPDWNFNDNEFHALLDIENVDGDPDDEGSIHILKWGNAKGNNKLYFKYYYGDEEANVVSVGGLESDLNQNTWTHLAFTWEPWLNLLGARIGTKIKIYVHDDNENKIKEETSTFMFKKSNKIGNLLKLSRNGENNQITDMQIDDLKIYDYAKTDFEMDRAKYLEYLEYEVQDIYYSESQRLVAYALNNLFLKVDEANANIKWYVNGKLRHTGSFFNYVPSKETPGYNTLNIVAKKTIIQPYQGNTITENLIDNVFSVRDTLPGSSLNELAYCDEIIGAEKEDCYIDYAFYTIRPTYCFEIDFGCSDDDCEDLEKDAINDCFEFVSDFLEPEELTHCCVDVDGVCGIKTENPDDCNEAYQKWNYCNGVAEVGAHCGEGYTGQSGPVCGNGIKETGEVCDLGSYPLYNLDPSGLDQSRIVHCKDQPNGPNLLCCHNCQREVITPEPLPCECTTSKCEGYDFYQCVNCYYQLTEEDSTLCGYVPCPSGDVQCSGYDYQLCVNRKWETIDTNSNFCGYLVNPSGTYDDCREDVHHISGCITDGDPLGELPEKCVYSGREPPFYKTPSCTCCYNYDQMGWGYVHRYAPSCSRGCEIMRFPFT